MQRTIDHTQLLPSLEPGVTRLQTPSTRSAALHSIVVDALVEAAGDALWIDSRNNASTYVLNGTAEDERLLRDLRIARAFTAYQHFSLVRDAVQNAGQETDLVVVPCIGALYRDDDLPEYRRSQLLESAVTMLQELGTSLDIPVVITDPGADDELAGVVDDHVDQEIACVKTEFGYRFETDGFETTVYWCDGFWQTTIPYWVELFGAVEEYEQTGVGVETLRPYVTG